MKMDYYMAVSFVGILLVCLSIEAKASREDSLDLLVRRQRHDSYYGGGDQYPIRVQKRETSLPGALKLFYYFSQKQLFSAKFYFANDKSDCENGPTESTQILVNPYAQACSQFVENDKAPLSLCLSQSIFDTDNKTLTSFFRTAIGQINPGLKMFINKVTEPQTTEKFMFVKGDCKARWLPLPKAPSKSKRDVKELVSKVWSGGFTRSGGFKMLLFQLAQKVLAQVPYYIADDRSDCVAGPGENEIFINPSETPCEKLNPGDAFNLCIRKFRDFDPNSILSVKQSFMLGGEPQGLKELLEQIANMPFTGDYSLFPGRCVHGWMASVESI